MAILHAHDFLATVCGKGVVTAQMGWAKGLSTCIRGHMFYLQCPSYLPDVLSNHHCGWIIYMMVFLKQWAWFSIKTMGKLSAHKKATMHPFLVDRRSRQS